MYMEGIGMVLESKYMYFIGNPTARHDTVTGVWNQRPKST